MAEAQTTTIQREFIVIHSALRGPQEAHELILLRDDQCSGAGGACKCRHQTPLPNKDLATLTAWCDKKSIVEYEM